jgi:DNA ligase-1
MNNNQTKVFPTLFNVASNGQQWSWDIKVEGDTLHVSAGTLGGQKTESAQICAPKNIGNSNETSGHQQAIKEAQSKWNTKKRKKYFLSIEEASKPRIQPMLAQGYNKRFVQNVKPAYDAGHILYGQPKLDGCRCMAYWEGDRVVLMSRGNKEWLFSPHIVSQLEKCLPKGSILDGELYIHGLTFQEITRYTNKKRDDGRNADLEYHVYDYLESIDDKSPQSERVGNLVAWYDCVKENGDLCANIKLTPTVELKTEYEVQAFQYQNLGNGYEGTIVRLPGGTYGMSKRSNDLLKLKDFIDDEFKVTGWEVGVGKFSNVPMFICVTKEGVEFRATPKGSMEARSKMLEGADSYIGKWYKVQFFGYTDDGVPRHPVGLGIRDEQDM